MEEKKGRSKRSKVDKGLALVLCPQPNTELQVTPELLMARFQTDYMQCTQLQKKGVKRIQETAEKKLESALQRNRSDWDSTFNLLVQKCNVLEELLQNTGFHCPVTLLGVPSQQLDKLEKVVFWARVVLSKPRAAAAGAAGPAAADNLESVQQLLDEVVELKLRVKEKHQLSETLSAELVSFATKHHALLTDCLTLNSHVFNLQEVLTKNIYNPSFDHNDVFHFFTDLESVVTFHNNLVEYCIRDQCVPAGVGFQKLKDAIKPTVEHLAAGCFIGLMVITNLEDVSDSNTTVNYDNMCSSVGEQLSGTCLKPGKKYVTWYVGQYAQDNVMDSVVEWSKAMDYLFYSVQKCPAAWNSEFIKGWKSTRIPGVEKPLYTCLLPGTKEVTRDTWSSVDTLDWIARSVHFWAHQLNTYAPSGYNLPLNHHFHRCLFLDTPRLIKFPQLWQYKKILTSGLTEFSGLLSQVQRAAHDAVQFVQPMKHEFLSCNFNLVYHQWDLVKEKLAEFDRVMMQYTEGKTKLSVCMAAVQQSVVFKLSQVDAWSRLYKMNVFTAVERYSLEMQQLCEEANSLLSADGTAALPVVLRDMTQCDEYVKHLEGWDKSWVTEMCSEVGWTDVDLDQFFTHFSDIKGRVKKNRNDCHPDRLMSVDADLDFFHLFQGWYEKLQILEKLNDLFFEKVR
jgi:hypothetical protein